MAMPPPLRSDVGVVVISSDDEEDTHGFQPLSSSSSVAVPVPPLPNGFVLAPIRGLGESERGRPERISTLREVLSTRNSRQRQIARRGRHQSGHSVPPPISRAPIISRTSVHTGVEPVEPGVYNPIRSRALLPHERQRRREGSNNASPAQQSGSLPSTAAGRLLNDGTISVDDVDDSGYTEATTRTGLHQGMGSWAIGHGRRAGAGRSRGRGETDDDDDDDDEEELYYSTSDEGATTAGASTSAQRQWWRDPSSGGPSFARRGQAELDRLALFGSGRPLRYTAAHEPTFFLPLHTGILSHHHHMQQQRRRAQRRHGRDGGSGGINHLDFFPGEDLGDLLSFLEANAPPPPPSRPLSPARPIKLTKLQEGLVANPDYSRKVPEANFRDSTETLTSKSLEIVCTQCTSSLFDKEHIWATPCGHVICNACVETFASASKSCSACKKRVLKKSLVHLFT
ncbi:hypothetical protein H4R27_006177 [Coemansia aciculifera]|nr:hypothetical protein H4R27_006177 [Coemansia aciculifera]